MKQIYEMVILGSGGDVGGTVQTYCVSNIMSVRKLEIKQIKFSLYVHAAYLAIIVFIERLTVYFTLIKFDIMGNNEI